MKEVIEEILLKAPGDTEVYAFGSVLKSHNPNDLDILIIYDSKVYPKASIYRSSESLIEILNKVFNLPIHLTVLSYSENKSIDFVREVKAIKLKYFLQNKLLK